MAIVNNTLDASDAIGDAQRQLHILVTEDSESGQSIALAVLRAAGHLVTLAGNGREALVMVQEMRFDAILMDIRMPVMDGFVATRMLRRDGVKTPIVGMIADEMRCARQRCIDAGMDAYLLKPLQARALLDKLRSLLNRTTTTGRRQ